MLDVDLIKERLNANLDKLSSYITQSQSLTLRKAAVLIALFDHNNETYVVLTKRSEHLRTHKGEVCFPGGKEDPGEGSVATALREAHEEIGLDPCHVTVIGSLAPMFTFSKLAVTPVLGVVHGKDAVKLAINDDEVSQVFACPLRIFLDASLESSRDVTVASSQNLQFHMHYFYHEFRPLSDVTGDFLPAVLGGPAECRQYKIFGLTARLAIASAIVCFGQPAVFADVTYTTESPQGENLENNIVWASRM